MLIITVTLELGAFLGNIGNQKHYVCLTKRKKMVIGTCAITSDDIADQDKERRHFYLRDFSRIYGTSYEAISTTPAGVCTS